MIKGIINLFKSGLILNPMILLGICTGIFLSYRHGLQYFYSNIIVNYDFYLICVSVAFVYTFAFRQVYKGYSNVVDWAETFKRFIGNSFLLIITTIFTVIFFGILFF